MDTHTHVWRQWPYATVVDPATRGSPARLLEHMDATGVTTAILIGAELGKDRGNNAFIFAAQDRYPERFIAFPDIGSYWSMDLGLASADLQTILRSRSIGGMTTFLAPHESGHEILRRDMERVFSLAADHRLVVSLGMRAHHSEVVAALATRNPGVRFMLHHFGGVTARTDEPLESQWQRVRRLADLSNIVLKASGFGYLSTRPWQFPYAEHLELVHRMINCFGADRVVWGSNFPVIDQDITYRQALELGKIIPAPQDQVLRANALGLPR